jgi:hypothetical protein
MNPDSIGFNKNSKAAELLNLLQSKLPKSQTPPQNHADTFIKSTQPNAFGFNQPTTTGFEFLTEMPPDLKDYKN